MSISRVARTNVLAMTAQVAIVVGIVVALVVVGLRQSTALIFQFTGTTEHEHLPPFLLMLMIPAWTITGFDVAGNFADEATHPERAIPRVMTLAAFTTFVLGTALFIVPLLALPGDHAAARDVSIPIVLTARLGPSFSKLSDVVDLVALFFLPLVIQLVSARILWAQAYDGIWPRSSTLVRLDRRGVPVQATLLCAFVAAAICVAWPVLYGANALWPALWMCGYCLTIAADLHARGRNLSRPIPDRVLGRWGAVNDVLAAGWSGFLVLLLPLLDAVHAFPLFAAIILLGLLAYLVGVGRGPAKPRGVESVVDVG